MSRLVHEKTCLSFSPIRSKLPIGCSNYYLIVVERREVVKQRTYNSETHVDNSKFSQSFLIFHYRTDSGLSSNELGIG